jgi:molecular chaperone DnaK
MGYQLGIDLGTTYTAAAVCRSDDRRWVEPEVVTLGTRSATVPSVLFVAPDGSVLVGEAAERRAVTDPDRVVREFKRRIGDPTPVVVAGRAWAPEELSARLVRWVVDRVAEREGGAAARIAVTHPASWGQHKRELLAAALAGQGLTVTFLAEPQAAALHYAANERIAPGSTIAVYDLGGGTFDAAVVRKADPAAAAATGAAGFGLLGRPEGADPSGVAAGVVGFGLLGRPEGADPSGVAAGVVGFGLLGRPEGIARLGGVDFDEAVFEHVREGLPAAFEDLDEADPAALSAVARVRRECTEAKEALSSDTEVSIPVLMPAARGSVRLHRSEFESMIRPHVEETVAALRTAVRSAALAPEQLSTVLLVGGSSRIPLVAQLVSEQLGRPVAVDTDPKNAIAKGAALAVSPKPTASWPEVAIAPVPVAVGAGVGAPPARPPRPGMPLPPPAPLLSHEPATSLLSDNPPPPDHRPRVDPVPAWEYEPAPAPRRNLGLLAGIGGLLAVLGVVIVTVVLSSSSTPIGQEVGSSGSTTSGAATSADATSADAPPATSAPAAGVAPKPATGGGAAPRPATGGGSGGTGTGGSGSGTGSTGAGGTGGTGGTGTGTGGATTQPGTTSAPPAPATTQPAGTGTEPTGTAQGPTGAEGTTAPGPTAPAGGGTTEGGGVASGGTPIAGGSTAVAEPPATSDPAAVPSPAAAL